MGSIFRTVGSKVGEGEFVKQLKIYFSKC